MHLVLCEMLRSRKMHAPEHSSARKEINIILQSATWVIRASVPMITKYSPGQLISQRDMIIHKKMFADLELIHTRCRAQQTIDNNRENRSRTNYKYKAGAMVRIITTSKERKGKLIGFEHPSPYEVTCAYDNGIITIRCRNIHERINIRRVKKMLK